jgi:peroxiredoxin
MKHIFIILTLFSSLCLSAQSLSSSVESDALLRIKNFLNDYVTLTGAGLQPIPAQQQADLIRFINEDLNMDVLAESGYWNHAISATFGLFPDKKNFASAMVNNLKRTKSQQVFERLSNDLVTICEQYGWFDAEEIIVSYLQSSGRIINPRGKLLTAFKQNETKAGSVAIAIEGIDNLQNSLLIFYDSGCDHCQAQIETLKTHYAELQAKGIRVISIASDIDTTIFTNYADSFPWKDKLCDFQGFNGKNFVNYAVMGTPTLFMIDENGKIIGRYAMLNEIIK